mmetsp:Transcript_10485/g.9034  ORF Transcript_10485/g.9034 Transcript_10485/m.9034 type:complete len:93 (+) Transcript_10485:744-1022(+)|eukprot:CAMPEP_0114587418 /NCGR_PEP_ID=MMETSP0125-20121206/10380_1 /TAXON_ID=485358 ORGANISM="Aristerostoma sp., Strain ATCC 50986" /NCGR_SAMPLE_ID=MMETSP0125 /ASSEMBLY_ACC=CAM_ASM_000245 /LENGTH=92 /DNA_ID=CAMNT_0001783313 /DNA_START=718 /DNA_END=996 /DNA_ORIENTATION=+
MNYLDNQDSVSFKSTDESFVKEIDSGIMNGIGGGSGIEPNKEEVGMFDFLSDDDEDDIEWQKFCYTFSEKVPINAFRAISDLIEAIDRRQKK